MEPPQTSIGISEGLDRSFNFSEVFQLVKKSVKTSIGKRRTGLMLGPADLPEYIGAFHQMGSNFIVMNRSLLDQVTHLAKDRRYLNAYVFYTLLHEYLHTLGYVDEGEVRRLTRQICARVLGPDHPATRLAADGPAVVFPEITSHHLASQSPHRACSLSLMTGWASDLTFYSTQLLGMGCSSPTPSTVIERRRLRGATVTGCLKEILNKAGPARRGLYLAL